MLYLSLTNLKDCNVKITKKGEKWMFYLYTVVTFKNTFFSLSIKI